VSILNLLPDGRRLTLSVGVAKFSREMDISSFVAAAYDAMVAAKKAGGDRTVLAGAPDKG